MLLVKNAQFLSNEAHTEGTLCTHEYFNLTKFHSDTETIVDFLLLVYFWISPDNFCSPSIFGERPEYGWKYLVDRSYNY